MPKYLKLITRLAVAGGGILLLVAGMGNPGLSIVGIILFIAGMYEASGAAQLLRRSTS